ncbi:beta-N-acetylhexosaminidase [Sulfuriroseicoccus oceanibius]|uniref:beta-N-acetylhexosaminidase n=1 Tax=Sulfuriroseicoccus oceanibius TaxID=2707525 RepID=A0A6B3LDS9_9BACT|nr:beta-N-acetylhexosaminidase [Sulfuriroseicoccus oceanibius]QQL45258.1 beta-N-acetylhexosaminidase [Sulfuriroseicoccus oceanibius]
MKLNILPLLACVPLAFASAKNELIIPEPAAAEIRAGGYQLSADTVIHAPSVLANEAKALQSALAPATGWTLKIDDAEAKSGIVLRLNPSLKGELGEEGYKLDVREQGVVIVGAEPAGVFYGIQTLKQMLPEEVVSSEPAAGVNWELPVASITDQPRFAWRAFMLDEARHFKGEKEVKKLLDQMAALKMNVFHWHLTDDQGWRIEIKKYPKLTEIGSKRTDTQTGTWGSPTRSGEPHSGFYTQEQIKDILKYAADRHITIVPEIGMPGHAVAAIASYPELGTRKEPIEVMTVFGKAIDVYDPSSEFTYQFISDVLDEVVALFPSQIIHIGGDEVRFDHWKSSESVKQMMEREGLKTMADVQIYFTNRVAQIVQSKGRNIMGWNEILGDDLHGFLKDGQTAKASSLDPDTVVHFWKGGADLARRAIKNGHRIVNSWHGGTYLDYGYGTISLRKAYDFEPIIGGLTPEEENSIKGLGCQMWGEWIPTVERMEYQIYPRLAAYAEVGWTPRDKKDYKSFTERMKRQFKRWDIQGIGYANVDLTSYSAKDFFNWSKVGTWSANGSLADWQTIDVPAGEVVKAEGKYDVVFLYSKGAHALDISEVHLLEDGKVVSTDKHDGFSGNNLKGIVYSLELKAFKPGAKYTIQAKVKGSGGTDSNGEIKMQLAN